MEACIHKILPFSSVDGPGNRTVIFFQGCNFDCTYCHNPETRERFTKEVWLKQKESLPKELKDMQFLTPEQVMERVKKQIPFIRGITVSGGECMLWADFLTRLFTLAKQAKLSTLIDSNGSIPFSSYPKLLEVTDGVMLDVKAFDEQDHLLITKQSNGVVLENVRFLGEKHKLAEVRIVVALELFDPVSTVKKIGEFLKENTKEENIRVKLIAFRPMGVRKEYAHYSTPGKPLMNQLAQELKQQGFKQIIII